MKLKLQICLYFSLIACISSTIWAQDIHASFTSNNTALGQIYIYSTAVDDSGNFYQTGYLNGSCNVAFLNNESKILHSNGNADIYLAKYNERGNLLWAKNIGGNGSDFASKICLDKDQNILLAASFSGNISIDSSNNKSQISSNGASDIFLLKLNKDGEFIWVKTWGNAGYDQIYDLKVSPLNRIAIVGNHNFDIDLDPGVGSHIESGIQARFSYTVVLNADGDYLWSKHIKGEGDNHLYALCFDGDDNLYLAGSYSNLSRLDLNPNAQASVARGSSAAMVLKFSSTGEALWHKSIDGSNAEDILQITTTPNNELIVAGLFNGSMVWSEKDSFISKGNTDIFIAQINSMGQTIWNKQIGSSGTERLSHLAVDQSFHIWTVGSYGASCDFNPGTPVYKLPFSDISDGFLSQLNYLGEFEGAMAISSMNDDIGSTINCHQNKILFCGVMSDSVTLQTAHSKSFLKAKNKNLQAFVIQLQNDALSVSNLVKGNQSLVYPNPFTDCIRIENLGITSIELYNSQGQLLIHTNAPVSGEQTELYTDCLEPGIYCLKIKRNDHIIETQNILKINF